MQLTYLFFLASACGTALSAPVYTPSNLPSTNSQPFGRHLVARGGGTKAVRIEDLDAPREHINYIDSMSIREAYDLPRLRTEKKGKTADPQYVREMRQKNWQGFDGKDTSKVTAPHIEQE